MTQAEIQTIRESFEIMRDLASICATGGINTETQEKANKLIQNLLDNPVKNGVQLLTARSAGIITKT
jgi:hypothetical protein